MGKLAINGYRVETGTDEKVLVMVARQCERTS